jgi:response regulator RpfG family c-di-GMP phosphodiesterase
VVLTGRFSSADVERATILGVADYVAKPINEVIFFGRLAELAGSSRRSSAPIMF